MRNRRGADGPTPTRLRRPHHPSHSADRDLKEIDKSPEEEDGGGRRVFRSAETDESGCSADLDESDSTRRDWDRFEQTSEGEGGECLGQGDAVDADRTDACEQQQELDEVERNDPERDEEPSFSDQPDALVTEVENRSHDIGSFLSAGYPAEPRNDVLAEPSDAFCESFASHDESENDSRNDERDQAEYRWKEELSCGMTGDDEEYERKDGHRQLREDIPDPGNKDRQGDRWGGETP